MVCQMFLNVFGTIPAVEENSQVVHQNPTVIETCILDPAAQMGINQIGNAGIIKKLAAKIKTTEGSDPFAGCADFDTRLPVL